MTLLEIALVAIVLATAALVIWITHFYNPLDNPMVIKRLTPEQVWEVCGRENKLEHAETPICFKCGFYTGRRINKYDSNGLAKLSVAYAAKLEEVAKMGAEWRFGDIPEDWRHEGVTSIGKIRF